MDLEMQKPSGSSQVEAQWWLSEQLQLRVNGVFKGGGGKGILYAGALLEVRDHGYWFRAVAGASAGAITAALVASGLKPEEIIETAPEGLRAVKRMLLGDLIGSPLFRTEKVALWLEQVLANQVRRLSNISVPKTVTFAHLFEASGIELFVIAVDVADRQPRVFSASTTPDVSIVDAVLASSAIPMAFRPGRLEVREMNGNIAIHRLMDGGVWANYPAFLFKDPSFRAYHQIPPLPDDSLTIGFTLDSGPAAERSEPLSFRRGMRDITRDKGGFLPWIFRFGPLRLYLLTVWPLVIVAQLWYTLDKWGLVFLKDYATRPGVPVLVTNMAAYFDGFTRNFMLHSYLFYVFALVLVAMALFSAVLGATMLDSGMPAMRTLMSVGTDVPYWVGSDDDDHVIRLRVPSWLTTTTFKISPELFADAIADARNQAREQLELILTRI